jgi:hypothetical protein
VPISVRQPVYEALNPDLIIWHMKEGVTAANSNNFNECEQWWRNACPRADVVYIGTPYGYWDTTNTLTTDHNRMVRNIAVRFQRPYVDLMERGVSFDWLLANGLMGPDGVHLSHPGGQWAANLAWNDLGLYALAVPRSVSLQLNSHTAQVSFLAATGAVYSLEHSVNSGDWLTVSTLPGTGTMYSTNLPRSSNVEFFRLRLHPP